MPAQLHRVPSVPDPSERFPPFTAAPHVTVGACPPAVAANSDSTSRRFSVGESVVRPQRCHCDAPEALLGFPVLELFLVRTFAPTPKCPCGDHHVGGIAMQRGEPRHVPSSNDLLVRHVAATHSLQPPRDPSAPEGPRDSRTELSHPEG